jgi:NitT/TauT family transport system substrate-binding protein
LAHDALSWLLAEISAQSRSWLPDMNRAVVRGETYGVEVVAVDVPGFEASKSALRRGEVDVILSNWFWVSRERAAGAEWVFAPFSTASGVLVTPPASAIRALTDLKGRHIGVTGTAHDEAWTILRLAARREGWDPAREARPDYGPPPAIASRLEKGDFDAALLNWSSAARLEARRAVRPVLSVADALQALGFKSQVPLLGFVFSERWARENPAAIQGFLRAAQAAERQLATSDGDWLVLITGARDRAELDHIRDGFRAGIPKHWGPEEQAEAVRLFAMVAEEIGDRELTGRSNTLAPGTFFATPL